MRRRSAIPATRTPIAQTKMPIPGPYLLTRSSWFEGLSDKTYPTREDLAKDVVRILRREVLRAQGNRHRLHPARRALDLAGRVRRRGRADLHVRGARFAHRSDHRARIRGAPGQRDRRRNRRRAVRRARLPRQLEPQGERAARGQLRAAAAVADAHERRSTGARDGDAASRRDRSLQGISQREGDRPRRRNPRTDTIESPRNRS